MRAQQTGTVKPTDPFVSLCVTLVISQTGRAKTITTSSLCMWRSQHEGELQLRNGDQLDAMVLVLDAIVFTQLREILLSGCRSYEFQVHTFPESLRPHCDFFDAASQGTLRQADWKR